MARNHREWAAYFPTISPMELLDHISPTRTVLRGPFQGMRYPGDRAVGSTFAAKILGSYEAELHPLFTTAIAEPYDVLVDIGCAEGYYAIGMALRQPRLVVHAYDTAQEAREACRRMAGLNGVADRVQIADFCAASTLDALDLGQRALIVSDCEGYERSLFSQKVCRRLSLHDVLIEVHDYKDPEISGLLRNAFRETHSLRVIDSIPDRRRPLVFPCEELDGFDAVTQISLMAELRPAEMEWFFFQARAKCHDEREAL